MDQDESKRDNRIILSVIGGLVFGFFTFIALILFFFSIGLFGWSDGGEKSDLDRLETTTNLTLAISVIAGFAVCIYFIKKMNKPKQKNNDPSPPDIPLQ